MGRGVSEKTKKLTISAMLSALGVVLLLIGLLVDVLDLSMAAVASFLCIFAVIEIKGIYPWLIYAVTGVLAVILMPQSLGAWSYLMFFGFYPIIKEKIEKLSRISAWIVKLGIFNLTVTVILCLFKLVFANEFNITVQEFSLMLGGVKSGTIIALFLYAVLNLTFVLYDIALTRLMALYFKKLRGKFKFLK